MKQVTIFLLEDNISPPENNVSVYTVEKTKYQSFPWGITIVVGNSVISIPWQQIKMVKEYSN